jgi:hypothetical protein
MLGSRDVAICTQTGTTTWLDYPAETLDLDPGRKVERDFTVTIPDDTPPGQYITGIVLQTAEPIAVGESTMLRQNIVKAIAVFITIPEQQRVGVA